MVATSPCKADIENNVSRCYVESAGVLEELESVKAGEFDIRGRSIVVGIRVFYCWITTINH